MAFKFSNLPKGQTIDSRYRVLRFLQRIFWPFWKTTFAIVVFSAFLVAGCSTQAKTEIPDYPIVYQTITDENHNGATLNGQSIKPESDTLEAKFEDFILLFSEFKQEDMRPRVESVYAEELYFNDTLHTFSSRDVMLKYMQETADRVDYTNVEIKDIVQSGDDFYVRWAMDTGFTVFGKQIETHSIGMTHVRFNESGQINFHQDFWDNTEGFFRHLPVIGFLINKTKERL